MNRQKKKQIMLLVGACCVTSLIGAMGGMAVMSAAERETASVNERCAEALTENGESVREQDRASEQQKAPQKESEAKQQERATQRGSKAKQQEKEPKKESEAKQQEQIVYVGDSLLGNLDVYGILDGVPNQRLLYKDGVSPFTFYKGSMMEQLMETRADRMYLLLGMNALDGEPSENQIASAITFYQKIIEEYQAKYPDAELCVLALPPVRPNASQNNSTIRQFNKKLEVMAKTLELPYLEVTEELAGDDGLLSEKYSEPDGTHWNIEGCRRFLSLMDSCE